MEMTQSSERTKKDSEDSGIPPDMELCLNYVFLPDEELVLKCKQNRYRVT